MFDQHSDSLPLHTYVVVVVVVAVVVAVVVTVVVIVVVAARQRKYGPYQDPDTARFILLHHAENRRVLIS